MMRDGEYTDLDRWEDEQTVKEMERSIGSAQALLYSVKRHIESDQYILDHAKARLAANPVEASC